VKKNNLLTVTLVSALLLATILPAVQPPFTDAAPPPPASPTPTLPPVEPGATSQPPHSPPSLDDLPPEMEQARARQAIEAALAKYLRYWGPRYQVAPVEVAVEREWAHGVAQWQSVTKTLSEPIHILAHCLPDGTWQALMPGSDGLYLQWLDAMPESLVPTAEKSQLRTLAAEADTLRRPQTTPVVPLAVNVITPTEGQQGSPLTPIPLNQERSLFYEDSDYGYSVNYPATEWVVAITLENPGTPDHVIKRRTTLFGPQGAQINIDVWINASDLGLMEWFDEYQRPLISGAGSAPSEPNAQVGGVPAVFTIEPATLYAPARLATVFLWTDRAFRVEYWTFDSGPGQAIYSEVLDSFRFTDTPEPSRASLPSAELNPSTFQLAGVDSCCNYSAAGNPYPCGCGGGNGCGNCTWWAWYRRADVGDPLPSHSWGNAHEWDTRAASEGWTVVEGPPQEGAIIVLEPGEQDVDSTYGHVAYVEQKISDSQCRVSDMWYQDGSGNCGCEGVCCRVCTWYQYHTNGSRVHFIYRSGGTTCSAPSLIEPSDGAILSSNTVTFRWNAVSGCTFNGYTFRVCISPDVDNLSNCFIDTGEGGTQITETINGHDNQDLYWGVRAANAPGGAEWAVRRFRIQPGSASGNWNARYDQGSTCWWDPNCNMNPHCTEIINGPKLHKDWGSSAPCGGMNGDDWVGDFQATINFPAGDYVFHLDHDDGVKLWLNGQNIQERGGSGSGPVCPARHLSGNNQLRVLLREEGGDARVHLTWSTDTSICNPPPDPPALQSPANGSLFNEGQSITLCWSDTGDEYYGEVWGGPAGTTYFGWQSSTCRNIGSQWAGYTYSWHVRARNSAGTSGWSNTWTFTVRPAAPSNLSAQAASCSQVNLTWNDNSGNEEGYRIYRNGSYVGQVGMNTTSHQDTGLGENTSYSYYVKAFRGSIESDPSNTVNITTPPCTPPQPDLVPSQWGGWPYPIVPSSITGTTEVNTLYAGHLTYIDWGITNSGDADCGGDAYGNLYIDDTLLASYNFGDVQAGWTWAFFDWPSIVVETPGWHTLRFVADVDDLIEESDETNNAWQRDFYWTPTAPYADDMESGVNDWTAAGLWHQVDRDTSPYPESHSGSHSWWYGQDVTGNYDTGSANSGNLTSPPIYIPTSGYYLRFWYWYETETQARDGDQRWVQISVDDGPFNNVLQLSDDPMNWWLQSPAIDLSGYTGHVIKVRFHFNTIDSLFNDYRGWYIDDFGISTTPPPSCADSHEPNNTPAQAMAVAYGQTLSADICPGGDYDFYTFTGTAGDKVVVDIDAMSDGSLLDPYIFLFDSDGTSVLVENDDEILGEVRDAHLGYRLPHDGTYYIKVKAWNHPSVGGTDHFYTIRLLTDHASPSAEITSPDHHDWLDPTQQTITTNVSDNESGIRNVTFYWHDANWDGGSDWIVLEDDHDPRDGWTYNLDTSSIPEQPQDCVVFIYAFDWAGNYAGYGSYNLGIDRTPPTVSAETQQMYGDAPFRDFWVWWSGSDNLSGIASYDVQYRDGSAGTWTDLLVDTAETYHRFVGQDGHTYCFRACARDFAGNQSAYAGSNGDAQHTVQTCYIPSDAYEADNTATSARWIQPDAPLKAHNFHVEEDQDWVRFYAAAGITYTLATTSTSAHADTMIYLYNGDGTTLIDYNDDYPGMWPLSRLDWRPSTSGFYLVKVQHWDPWAYGCTTEYGLSMIGSEPTPFSQVYLPLVLCNR
jgi:surface antigen